MAMPSHGQLLFDQVGGSIWVAPFSFSIISIGLSRQVILASNIGSQE
jgi:hypothetical protein